MKKIQVLHIELDQHLGGIESFLYNLYSKIDRDKIQFDFITRSENPAKGKELEALGAKVYKVQSYNKPISYMGELNRVISEGKYDVVHIHKNSAANILPFIVTKMHKEVKVFVHSHNTKPSVEGIPYLLHEINKKFLWNNSDYHFACSKVAGEWLYGPNKKFDVLKNGIAVENYKFSEKRRSEKRKQLGIADDEFVIGNIGRFTLQKNQKRLVDIFENYSKRNSKCRLIFIGDGELKESVQKYTIELGMENVDFLGIREDIPELLMAMDLFVMPSLYEGLPIVGVEAQATGLRVLAADSVSKETKIINEFEFFSLNEENNIIADRIVGYMKKSYNREQANSIVENAGYNMTETARKLMDMYLLTAGE